ncbi:MAG: hypothetical protein M3Y27_05765 [Acidobacteriota bacterium]|nr:hypothetical protein [Acidobacteriota bacterium]
MRPLILIAAALTCAGAEPAKDINQAWSEVLGQASTVRPTVLSPIENRAENRPGADFLNHLFLQSRTEYIREQTSFTGLPTLSGVINATPGESANAAGIPYPGAFQPSANRVYEMLNFGMRGWLSPRLDSNFTIRYQQDLTPVDSSSPALNLLNTFPHNRRIELLDASVDIHGLSGTNVRVGRQYIYGAELAAFDGASISFEHSRYSMTLYGGRRFSLYADPVQRAIGGGNFRVRLNDSSSLEYDALWYVRASQSLTYRKRFYRNWFLTAYFRTVGGSPVDLSSQLLYLSASGKTTARVAFFQKLSSKDFFYDYTTTARDLDPHNPISRLNLGPISPYTQVAIDAHRAVWPRLRVGGLIWIRRLNDSSEQSAFNTSFADWRLNAQVFALRKTEFDVEFHQHNSHRSSPSGAVLFDDISRSGETRIQDITAEVRRPFAEGRLTLSAGGFYRRLDFQDQFRAIKNAHDRGLLGSAWYRIDPKTRLWFDYSLDNDYAVFRPDIRHSTILRLGLDWKY